MFRQEKTAQKQGSLTTPLQHYVFQCWDMLGRPAGMLGAVFSQLKSCVKGDGSEPLSNCSCTTDMFSKKGLITVIPVGWLGPQNNWWDFRHKNFTEFPPNYWCWNFPPGGRWDVAAGSESSWPFVPVPFGRENSWGEVVKVSHELFGHRQVATYFDPLPVGFRSCFFAFCQIGIAQTALQCHSGSRISLFWSIFVVFSWIEAYVCLMQLCLRRESNTHGSTFLWHCSTLNFRCWMSKLVNDSQKKDRLHLFQ